MEMEDIYHGPGGRDDRGKIEMNSMCRGAGHTNVAAFLQDGRVLIIGPDRHCPPRQPTLDEPLFLELKATPDALCNDVLFRRAEPTSSLVGHSLSIVCLVVVHLQNDVAQVYSSGADSQLHANDVASNIYRLHLVRGDDADDGQRLVKARAPGAYTHPLISLT